MTTPAVERQRAGLIDRRLAARSGATRRYLATAIALGVVATASVVAQAVLIASVVAASLEHTAPLGAVWGKLVGIALAFLVRAACGWAAEAAAQRTSAQVTAKLRRDLLRHAMELGPRWLAGERAGELSVTATRGASALDTYFGRYLPAAVLAALAPAVVLAWVGWTDWPSLLVLLGMVALIPIAMVHFGRASLEATKKQWGKLSSLSAHFVDLLSGLPTLRAFGRESHGRREVAEATEGLGRATMSTLRVAFLSALSLEFLAGIGTGLVAMVLGLRLLEGTVGLASALAVLLVSPEVFLPLRRAAADFHSSAEGQAAAKRILDVLDEAPARAAHAADAAHAAPVTIGLAGPGTPSPHQAVALEQVTVRYPGRAVPALERFDLVVGAGEHVALVGPSGSGKSTVVGLILGFVEPESGRVLGGGLDLGGAGREAWRAQVSWVPQRPQLLHGSFAENLRIGRPDASLEELEGVVELVGLGHLLSGLPRRLATPLGEGGLALSAGERSRVAIARAVLRDAPMVVLDEPVAHLDEVTADALCLALSTWFESKTVLLAAHRPSLLARIDRTVSLRTPVSVGVA